MADIFFSYKREDRHRVQLFCLELQKLGFDVAWDQKILTGQAWEDWILSELVASKVVLVFWSHESIQSDYVKKEARLAYQARKLLPVYIDRLSAIEKAGLLGFDGLQYAELWNWKGKRDDPTWQALITAIERAITPAYVERLLARKNDELYTARLLRDTVVERETTFEKQVVEVEQARLEATTRERKTALDLAETTSKLKEAEARESEIAAKASKLEASAQEARTRLAEAEAAARRAQELLHDSSTKLRLISEELGAEKIASKMLRAKVPNTKQNLKRVASIVVAALAAGAASMWALQPAPLREARAAQGGGRALIACETLAGDHSKTPLASDALRTQIAGCKTALSNWSREVAHSTRPVIARFGSVQDSSDGRVSGWAADIGTTLRTELSNSGLALVSDLASLKQMERENVDLRLRVKHGVDAVEQVKSLKAQNVSLSKEAERYRQQLEARGKAEPADACDRLAGDPSDEVQTAARRPTRQSRDLESNPAPAIRACEDAVKSLGEPRFRYQLGRALLAAKDKKALDELEEARRAGYVASATLLALNYRDGVVSDKDLEKALRYYEQAVALDDPAAMVQMAHIYRMENPSKAFTLISQAAKRQFPSAMATLGDYYVEGKAVKKDCGEAIRLFTDAARLGNAKAVDNLSAIATKKGC